MTNLPQILVALYTCDREPYIKRLEFLKTRQWFKKLECQQNVRIIKVTAGAIETTFDGVNLKLNCPEEYKGLCKKTFMMNQFVNNNLSFDYFVKIDDDFDTQYDLYEVLMSDWQVKKSHYLGFNSNYDKIQPVMPAYVWHFMQQNKLPFTEQVFDYLHMVPYYGGCCYALSKAGVNAVANSTDLFNLFHNYIFIEDYMVGQMLYNKSLWSYNLAPNITKDFDELNTSFKAKLFLKDPMSYERLVNKITFSHLVPWYKAN